MAYLEGSGISCGVDQLEGLYNQTPLQIIYRVARCCLNREAVDIDYDERRAHGFGYIIFSDTIREDNGQKLADYIHKNKLGAISSPKAKRNPNSGNMIKVWTWSVNNRALARWYKEKHK